MGGGGIADIFQLLMMVWLVFKEFFLDGVVLYRVAPYDAVPNVDIIVGVVDELHTAVAAYLAFATTAIVDVMIVATTLVAVVLSFLLMLLLSLVLLLLMLALLRRKSASS